MAQAEALIATLKQCLKTNNLTYALVAKHLNMSEANIKRQFASKRFNLNRVEEICQLMNMELSDLFLLHEENKQAITQLTIEQEESLVKDIKLLLVAVSVRNRLSFKDILNHYDFSEPELVRCLAALDRLKIIDLLPNNRIKLLIDENFRWNPKGPIERFYEQHIQGQFLRSSFSAEFSQRIFLFGLLTETSTQLLMNRMRSLAKEFTDIHRQDMKLPVNKRNNIGFMLAMRPWEAHVFKPFSKETK